jgi:hypothetical protein
MAYGHSTRASARTEITQHAPSRVSETLSNAWRQLDPEKRLRLVEQVLANDGFPLAL